MFKNDRERFEFIDNNRLSFPLRNLCRALEVSRSGYYAYKKRPKCKRRLDNDKLLIEIRRVFLDNNSNYGSPRIWNQLNNAGHILCSENRLAKVMRFARLIAVQKRKFRVTTCLKHNYPVWLNILSRNFNVERPNNVWVSDITYIWTHEGWLYLAAVIDLFS
ncbi:MAG: IS3 family transposase [Candidatus Omnitrophota bacterium]